MYISKVNHVFFIVSTSFKVHMKLLDLIKDLAYSHNLLTTLEEKWIHWLYFKSKLKFKF